MIRVRVLGSGAGGGFPQWNCACALCRRAWAGEAGVRARTQSSLAVSGDGLRWFLLNASPDLRQQVLCTPDLKPRGSARTSPIAGVVLTNADVDHVAGLLSLREGGAFSLYASARVLGVLEANRIFRVLDLKLVPRRALELGGVQALEDAAGAADPACELSPHHEAFRPWAEAAKPPAPFAYRKIQPQRVPTPKPLQTSGIETEASPDIAPPDSVSPLLRVAPGAEC